ncbi:MAG: DUF4097 family beta strand repeat-containing protein [Acidobacteriota bacterium]
MHSTKVRLGWVAMFLALAGAGWASDYRIEKRFDLAAGGTFALHSEVGKVTVHGGSGSQAVIVVNADRDDFAQVYDVRFDPQPARVAVTIERKDKSLFHWFGGYRGSVMIDVELPAKVGAEVESSGGSARISDLEGNVDVSSSGGSVQVERVQGALRADSSGGRVEARDVTGRVHLQSSGGSIVAEGIDGDLEASSSGGSVRVDDAHGEVTASSSGGPVRVAFAAGNARGGSLDSSGGGVSAHVDPAVGLEIDASSSGGSVSTDLPITIRGKVSRARIHGTLNGGGALLKLRSSGGGITLEPR